MNTKNKKIFVTGGCGYVGTLLIPELLLDGHFVVCYDTQWFGNYIEQNENLKLIKGDIKDIDKIDLKGIDTIIHLANIANDPGVELNQTYSLGSKCLSIAIYRRKSS